MCDTELYFCKPLCVTLSSISASGAFSTCCRLCSSSLELFFNRFAHFGKATEKPDSFTESVVLLSGQRRIAGWNWSAVGGRHTIYSHGVEGSLQNTPERPGVARVGFPEQYYYLELTVKLILKFNEGYASTCENNMTVPLPFPLLSGSRID